jgi:hypothetical protein|tara:strand:+ start:4735 stop:5181 length:447 start_codon:yes stop_codon:yes gene_type:complete
MTPHEKLKHIFSPLDLLVVEKEYQYLFPVDESPDVPEELYNDAKMYLSCGEYFDRNPSVWRIFLGDKTKTDSNRWKNGILNYYRMVCMPVIVPVDQDRNHISMTAKFEILVINSRHLPEDAFEGVKCAIVKTQFGEFQIAPEDSENTE